MKRALSLTAALLCVLPPVSSAKPLKVFILAGQSNMQGHVNVSTFGAMEDDRKTAPILKEMLAADGKPKVCEKIWISSIGCAGDDTTEQKGIQGAWYAEAFPGGSGGCGKATRVQGQRDGGSYRALLG